MILECRQTWTEASEKHMNESLKINIPQKANTFSLYKFHFQETQEIKHKRWKKKLIGT